MCELNTDQRLDLTEQLADAYSHELDSGAWYEDIALEVIDSWLPVYYHTIREEWVKAGCPDVEDVGLISDEKTTDPHHIMTVSLYEQANAWLWKLTRDYYDGNVLTVEQALEACNTYLQVHGKQPYTRNGLRAVMVTA